MKRVVRMLYALDSLCAVLFHLHLCFSSISRLAFRGLRLHLARGAVYGSDRDTDRTSSMAYATRLVLLRISTRTWAVPWTGLLYNTCRSSERKLKPISRYVEASLDELSLMYGAPRTSKMTRESLPRRLRRNESSRRGLSAI